MRDQLAHRRPVAEYCGQFVVAAEWIGILSSRSTRGDDLRFAPGGTAHAFDRWSGDVVCGADAQELEVFWIDFLADGWSFRCAECVARTSEPRAIVEPGDSASNEP